MSYKHFKLWLSSFDFEEEVQGLVLKVLIIHLLLVLEVMDMKQTYKKPWAGILLMWSYLT